MAEVVVIGIGIIGVSTALSLQKRGFSVTILDRDNASSAASIGNAGAFAFTDIEPLATPKIMFKAPKWLLDPLGPLSIPPAYLPSLMPWLLKFWRASMPDRFKKSVVAQASLMGVSSAALERQIMHVKGERFMQRDGQLQLYESRAEYDASLPQWALRKENGIKFELLKHPEQIAEIQPGLSKRFTHAGFTPDWLNACDPQKWHQYLVEQFIARGGKVEICDVKSLKQEDKQAVITTSEGQINAKNVVVAAGAWSHRLASTLGDYIPLETERGYNTTLPAGAFDVRTHLTFANHGFVVSRVNDGVRVGGAVELGGLERKPNYKRAHILLNKASDFLPGLNTNGGTQWMGFRPSMPDSLPVIGKSNKAPSVCYAFGHGHLGLTQSAGTAELVSALIANETPPIDISPFSAYRF